MISLQHFLFLFLTPIYIFIDDIVMCFFFFLLCIFLCVLCVISFIQHSIVSLLIFFCVSTFSFPYRSMIQHSYTFLISFFSCNLSLKIFICYRHLLTCLYPFILAVYNTIVYVSHSYQCLLYFILFENIIVTERSV